MESPTSPDETPPVSNEDETAGRIAPEEPPLVSASEPAQNTLESESASDANPLEHTQESEQTLPAPEVTSASLPPASRQGMGSTLLTILAFLLVGLLLGLRVAAQATLPHIFQPGDYVNFQDVVDGLPVPRLLSWNTEWLDILASLRELSGMSLLLAVVFVFGPLWLVIVRRVNPTFRLVSHAPAAPPADTNPGEVSPNRDAAAIRASASAALSTPLEFYGLTKGLTLLGMLGLPIAAAWILLDWDDAASAYGAGSLAPNAPALIGSVWAMRLALLGVAFWVGFHRDGLAGDFTRPEWNPSRRKLPLLALRGACFGLLMFAAFRIGLPQHLEDALIRLQTLGGFNIVTWNLVTTHVLLSFALVWFGVGCLFAFFSPPPHVRANGLLLGLPLAACALAGVYQRQLAPQTLAARYDIRPETLQTIPENLAYSPKAPASGVPDGADAAQEMARQLHLSSGKTAKSIAEKSTTGNSTPASSNVATSGRTLVLFADEPLLVYQNNLTQDGLTPDAALVPQVTDFLQGRRYQTAWSWMALKTLYNVSLLHFDTTGAIRVGIQDLMHSPHNVQFARTLEQMFAICAATPENEALLDQWADESKFDFPDRNSRRVMGDLYRRFGNIEKALFWYRKADMPSSFLKRISTEKPMYRTGTIHGVLVWNGRPLAGAQVAVVPRLMNGLPAGMEGYVADALRGMLNAPSRFNPVRANPGLFPRFHPSPWQSRWISAAATTDSRGAYRIEHLTEGTYSAICTLPSGIQTMLPLDNRLQITHPISRFNLNYHQTGYDMGTTEFKWKE